MTLRWRCPLAGVCCQPGGGVCVTLAGWDSGDEGQEGGDTQGTRDGGAAIPAMPGISPPGLQHGRNAARDPPGAGDRDKAERQGTARGDTANPRAVPDSPEVPRFPSFLPNLGWESLGDGDLSPAARVASCPKCPQRCRWLCALGGKQRTRHAPQNPQNERWGGEGAEFNYSWEFRLEKSLFARGLRCCGDTEGTWGVPQLSPRRAGW